MTENTFFGNNVKNPNLNGFVIERLERLCNTETMSCPGITLMQKFSIISKFNNPAGLGIKFTFKYPSVKVSCFKLPLLE